MQNSYQHTTSLYNRKVVNNYKFGTVNTFVQYDARGGIHIGETLKAYLKEHDYNLTKLSSRLNLSRGGLYSIFERHHIDTDLLEKFCQITGHNFFQYYMEHLGHIPREVEVVHEPEPRYTMPERIVLRKEGGRYVQEQEASHETNQDLQREIAKLKEQQERMFKVLQSYLPGLGIAQAQNPEHKIDDDPTPKE